MLARWWRLYKVIEEEGDTYEVKGRDSQVRHRLRPEARTVMSLHDNLLKIERQFGMTPAAWAGLSIPPGTSGGTDDDRDDFQLRRGPRRPGHRDPRLWPGWRRQVISNSSRPRPSRAILMGEQGIALAGGRPGRRGEGSRRVHQHQHDQPVRPRRHRGRGGGRRPVQLCRGVTVSRTEWPPGQPPTPRPPAGTR